MPSTSKNMYVLDATHSDSPISSTEYSITMSCAFHQFWQSRNAGKPPTCDKCIILLSQPQSCAPPSEIRTCWSSSSTEVRAAPAYAENGMRWWRRNGKFPEGHAGCSLCIPKLSHLGQAGQAGIHKELCSEVQCLFVAIILA